MAVWSTASLSFLPNTAYSIMDVGDFNVDGKPDILWRNTPTGANAVCYIDGVTLSRVADLLTEVDQTWKIAGVGDFNGDLKPEVLRRKTGRGPNACQNGVWYIDGVSLLGQATLPFAFRSNLDN
jgi:hypothetical protein